ncbi:hypothetical protein [Streptomyces cacaoi]|uniref:Uncharacterized protein n=1 Tax=Streptomyces cacaoi TaxID=1898 RepID=A0A4Y3QY46_STRCI|nr:hypothetical protein [Streptomyces cacaoi]NNG88603.1 hypothetical protein [Streptomyces cacaoi]GEB49577.1 hypothetical protein SCA03_21280 [Streptomyces cacaoi]
MPTRGHHPYGPPRRPDGSPGPPGFPPQLNRIPFPLRRPPGPPPPPLSSLVAQFRSGDWPPLNSVVRRAPVRGCAWVPLLFPTLPLVAPVLAYPLVRSARRYAHRAFPPHAFRRPLDPAVLRVQRVRAWAALVASAVLLLAYGTADDFAELQDQYLLRVLVTPWLLLVTSPLVIVTVFLLRPAHERPDMRARLRPVVRTACWYFLAVIAFALAAPGSSLLLDVLPANPLLTLLFAGGALVALVWLLAFAGFATATLIPAGLGTHRVHPALPALLTGFLVWELALADLVLTGMPPGPAALGICSAVGGPLSVSLVVWWEIHRLRTRHGVRLRG